jgi:hypothetical protein
LFGIFSPGWAKKYQTKKIKYHVAVRRELVEGQATVAFA